MVYSFSYFFILFLLRVGESELDELNLVASSGFHTKLKTAKASECQASKNKEHKKIKPFKHEKGGKQETETKHGRDRWRKLEPVSPFEKDVQSPFGCSFSS
ncbi:hypothetical protein PanWU01x14_064200 [Parasponia andersonii]|uniref:Secreted protein n=1 Tax=Parasponia andersonii TaxID=3476 RepID=A0A2P5DH80_PARAD|nr:hypothetical protein PanWU01x14_064200 [Parasponia andersonii]